MHSKKKEKYRYLTSKDVRHPSNYLVIALSLIAVVIGFDKMVRLIHARSAEGHGGGGGGGRGAREADRWEIDRPGGGEGGKLLV